MGDAESGKLFLRDNLGLQAVVGDALFTRIDRANDVLFGKIRRELQ
jgi:hypothetical protein